MDKKTESVKPINVEAVKKAKLNTLMLQFNAETRKLITDNINRKLKEQGLSKSRRRRCIYEIKTYARVHLERLAPCSKCSEYHISNCQNTKLKEGEPSQSISLEVKQKLCLQTKKMAKIQKTSKIAGLFSSESDEDDVFHKVKRKNLPDSRRKARKRSLREINIDLFGYDSDEEKRARIDKKNKQKSIPTLKLIRNDKGEFINCSEVKSFYKNIESKNLSSKISENLVNGENTNVSETSPDAEEGDIEMMEYLINQGATTSYSETVSSPNSTVRLNEINDKSKKPDSHETTFSEQSCNQQLEHCTNVESKTYFERYHPPSHKITEDCLLDFLRKQEIEDHLDSITDNFIKGDVSEKNLESGDTLKESKIEEQASTSATGTAQFKDIRRNNSELTEDVCSESLVFNIGKVNQIQQENKASPNLLADLGCVIETTAPEGEFTDPDEIQRSNFEKPAERPTIKVRTDIFRLDIAPAKVKAPRPLLPKITESAKESTQHVSKKHNCPLSLLTNNFDGGHSSNSFLKKIGSTTSERVYDSQLIGETTPRKNSDSFSGDLSQYVDNRNCGTQFKSSDPIPNCSKYPVASNHNSFSSVPYGYQVYHTIMEQWPFTPKIVTASSLDHSSSLYSQFSSTNPTNTIFN